jgi:hypothetical protein
MKTERTESPRPNPSNQHQENSFMNLDTLARLETQARQDEMRHRLERRSQERAAIRRQRQRAVSGADGPGFLGRFIGWLAPRGVAIAGGEASPLVVPQSIAPDGSEDCSPCPDCEPAPARRAA